MMLSEVPSKDANVSFRLPDQTCQRLRLGEIELATNNFDQALVVGRGGFGKVYKSISNFGSSVNEVAIKRLHATSNQGAHEFEAEVKLLSTLRHGNLVPLIGYCSEGKEMILAYEFMPNGTLEDHLHRGISELSWLQRLKICIGATRGLDYLHMGTSTQHGVIHRDVKSSNILLDSNFDAKISDFGLAKVGTMNQTRTFHVSTLVKGTFGYMDPCYFHSGKLTRKSDVYAFGVVLFEVLSGKQAVDQTLDEDQWSLVVWAEEHFKEGRLNEMVDHRLVGQISKKCLKEFASIAVDCLHNQPKKRPTMAEVVVKLESVLSRERENASSGVDDGRFINKVRYFFIGKADLMRAHAEGSNSQYTAQYVEGSDSQYTAQYAEGSNSQYTAQYAEGSNSQYTAQYAEGSNSQYTAQYAEGSNFQYLYIRKDRWSSETSPSLDELLYGERVGIPLSWVVRLKIAAGTARILSVLHKKGHAAFWQFETACILVDEDYSARFLKSNVGNPNPLWLQKYSWYAGPEWFDYRKDIRDGVNRDPYSIDGHPLKSEIYSFGVILLEIKSEIYSLGVILLEMLTGMNVNGPNMGNLVERVTPLLPLEAKLRMILDPKLLDNDDLPKGAYRLALLVSNCLNTKPDNRPSMDKILQVLQECYTEQFFHS